jgi:hypothetical protein
MLEEKRNEEDRTLDFYEQEIEKLTTKYHKYLYNMRSMYNKQLTSHITLYVIHVEGSMINFRIPVLSTYFLAASHIWRNRV